MYTKFFGLQQEPFSIAPDPKFLFMSERHREALAHLLYGLGGSGGFVVLSGEIGAGKTTVTRCFLEQVPKRCNVAYIFNPKLTVNELLKSVCDEFRIPYPHREPGAATVKEYLDPLNEYLLRSHAVGQNNILVIDEAQNLSAGVLEQLRLLTNLETNERKLLQIILIGQPELRTILARRGLEQLAQRVIARFHLPALTERETASYIAHRLTVAGLAGALPFDGKALRRVYKLSRGVPRRINLLCDRAMLGAYAHRKPTVTASIIDEAAKEVFDQGRGTKSARWRYWRIATLGLVAGATLGGVAVFSISTGAFQRFVPADNSAAKAPTFEQAPATARAARASTVAQASVPARASAVARAPVVAPASTVARLATAATPAHAKSEAIASAASASALSLALGTADRTTNGKLAFKSRTSAQDSAWRELARLWDIELSDGDPCILLQRNRVRCVRKYFDLSLIRQIDRPGILTLKDGGRRDYTLLTGLTSRTASLRVGGVSTTLPLEVLVPMWSGEFATLWRVPPGYREQSAINESSEAVDWLSAQLTAMQGQLEPSGKTARTVPLKSRIYAFQLAQGLVADGIAGPITLMRLNRVAGIDEPRLQTKR